MKPDFVSVLPSATARPERAVARVEGPAAPDYLRRYYNWIYLHPLAVKLFERPWLIDLILCRRYDRLSAWARDGVADPPGRVLQAACAYGDFTSRLARAVQAGGGELEVVDVAPAQIDNLAGKLRGGPPTRLTLADTADLPHTDGAFDQVVMFFLLHEQPEDWRRRTLAEAVRVLRPGGRLVIVDYGRPRWPWIARTAFAAGISAIEPFAMDLWRGEAMDWTPAGCRCFERAEDFGGLYRRWLVRKDG